MSSSSLRSDRHQLESASEAIEFYFDQGWTDGLPVVPPTIEQVSRFLDHVGLQPAEILGTEPTTGRVVTAEKVAINAVMAGCKPEYFPVVVAAVEAVCQREFNLHAVTVSTMGSAVLVVVNGPIRDALELNSGVGAFGPGHRSNATIGRAVRLVIANVTGAVSGEVDKGTLGHGGKYSWCVAEAEETSPWQPLHVERGIPLAESAVTVFGALSPIQFAYHDSTAPEDILDSAADALYASGRPARRDGGRPVSRARRPSGSRWLDQDAGQRVPPSGGQLPWRQRQHWPRIVHSHRRGWRCRRLLRDSAAVGWWQQLGARDEEDTNDQLGHQSLRKEIRK